MTTAAGVPRLWPGSTIVCLGAGPSLTFADLTCVRDAAVHTIAINSMVFLATWAEVLYVADAQWWQWYRDVPNDQLPPWLFTLQPQARAHRPSVRVLRASGQTGLDTAPDALRLGGHGGYQAINLAVHLGAARIVLLGYDLQPGPDGQHHCHAEHPDGNHPNYPYRRGVYATLLAPLAALGVTIVNCSRATSIEAIPRAALTDVL